MLQLRRRATEHGEREVDQQHGGDDRRGELHAGRRRSTGAGDDERARMPAPRSSGAPSGIDAKLCATACSMIDVAAADEQHDERQQLHELLRAWRPACC